MPRCKLTTTHGEPAGSSRRGFRRDKPAGPLSIVLTLFVVGILSSLLGCGGSDQLALAPVTGKVTLDGQPLSEGMILFRPDMGRAGRGRIENGVIVEASTYGINDGIVLGNHKIAVQPIPPIDPAIGNRIPGDTGSDLNQLPSYAQDLRQQNKIVVQIPAKYQDPDQSGLSVEIKDDDNELNIELTKE